MISAVAPGTLTGSALLKYLFRSNAGTWTEQDIGTLANSISGNSTFSSWGPSPYTGSTTWGLQNTSLAVCPLGSDGTTVTLVGTAAISNTLQAAPGTAGLSSNSLTPYIYRIVSSLDYNGAISAATTVNYLTGCTGTCFSTSAGASSISNGQRSSLSFTPDYFRPVIAFTANTSTFVGAIPAACNSTWPTAAAGWGPLWQSSGSNDGRPGLAVNAIANSIAIVTMVNTNTTYGVYTSYMTVGASGTTIGYNATSYTITSSTIDNQAGGTMDWSGLSSVYDTINATMYLSYARLPLFNNTSGGDMVVAAAGTADIFPSATSGNAPYAMDVIDQTASATSTAAIPILAAAKASNGTVGAVYYYSDTGTAADSKLYYIVRGGTAANPTFGSNIVLNYIESATTTAGSGMYPAMAYDGNNQPIVAYYDGQATDNNLKVSRSSNNGVTFSASIVDDTQPQIGLYPSVAVSGTALGVAYYDQTNTALKFARWTASGGWRRYFVDGAAGTGSCGNAAADAGKYTSIQFSSTGRPAIAYQYNGGVRIAYASEALTSTSYSWTCVAVDTGANNRGEGIDLKLTSADIPHLAHFDSTAQVIRYVYASTAIATAIATGSAAFTAETVNGVGTAATGVTIPSLQLTTAGIRYVSYYSATLQALALSTKAVGGSSWSHEYIDEGAGGGSYTSMAGQYAKLLLNSNEAPLMFYRGRENWLRYFSREP